ncbi:MAG TPA: hypothetical protein PLU22_10855, partial [Polyangiaceae bacterium]|nr:hypothetical protein [Polyangiaceae bacterium]
MIQGRDGHEGEAGRLLGNAASRGQVPPRRCELVGWAGATVLVAAVSAAGCSDGGASGGTAGSSSGGATTSTGGTAATGGSVSSGGASTGGASGGGGVTSLSGGKLLSELTPAEATQLCSEAYAYLGTAISPAVLCKASGLTYTISSSAPTDAVMRENCTRQEAACLSAAPYVPDCAPIPSPCTATVAEYATCVADQAATYNATVPTIPDCAAVSSQDKAAIWDFVAALPASCSSLSPVCSGLDFPTPRVGEVNPSGSGGTGGTGGGSGGGIGGSGGTGGSSGGAVGG